MDTGMGQKLIKSAAFMTIIIQNQGKCMETAIHSNRKQTSEEYPYHSATGSFSVDASRRASGKYTVRKRTKYIVQNVFSYCPVTDITIPDSATGIGDKAFSRTGIKKITVSKKVKYIGTQAFDSCTSLKNVTIKDGVKIIGEKAFYGCTSLKSVTVPKSARTIGIKAFGYDSKGKIKGFKLKGYKGSEAQKYAKKNKMKLTELK